MDTHTFYPSVQMMIHHTPLPFSVYQMMSVDLPCHAGFDHAACHQYPCHHDVTGMYCDVIVCERISMLEQCMDRLEVGHQ